MASIEFIRQYGEHSVQTATEQVTIVSQPDWPGVRSSIERLTDKQQAGAAIGNFLLTPELITVADLYDAPVDDIPSIVDKRLDEAKDWSTSLPDSTLVVGSAVYDTASQRPTNALLSITNGIETGRIYKRYPLGLLELSNFEVSAQNVDKPFAEVGAVICGDFLAQPKTDKSTLLVSACWSVPIGSARVLPTTEQQHIDGLHYFIQKAFDDNLDLQIIAMSDRAPWDGKQSAPINFVARRDPHTKSVAS